jgi:hypothetical protein
MYLKMLTEKLPLHV